MALQSRDSLPLILCIIVVVCIGLLFLPTGPRAREGRTLTGPDAAATIDESAIGSDARDGDTGNSTRPDARPGNDPSPDEQSSRSNQ